MAEVELNRKRVEKLVAGPRASHATPLNGWRETARRLKAGEVVLDGEVEIVGGESLGFAVDFAEVFDLAQ